MGRTLVELDAYVVERLLEGVALLGDRTAAVELRVGPLRRVDVVGTTFTGPLPDDDRTGVDPDRRWAEREATSPAPTETVTSSYPVVMGVRGGYFSEKAVAGRRDDRPAVDGVSWPPR